MTTLTKAPRHTAEEYLAAERKAEYKSEFDGGEILPMSGASRAHNLIVTNITTSLNLQLIPGNRCEVYGADMRVHVPLTGLYTYPDVTVVCEEPRFTGMDVDTLLNPTALVEVLSDSTENRDRGEKFAQYQTVPALEEYVLIDQYRPRVEVFKRHTEGQWLYSRVDGLDASVPLASIGCTLALKDVYRRVSFEEPAASAPLEEGRQESGTGASEPRAQ